MEGKYTVNEGHLTPINIEHDPLWQHLAQKFLTLVFLLPELVHLVLYDLFQISAVLLQSVEQVVHQTSRLVVLAAGTQEKQHTGI